MTENTEDVVLEALRGVIDPEIGLNVVELGLIRDLEVENGHTKITKNLWSNLPNDVYDLSEEGAKVIPFQPF